MAKFIKLKVEETYQIPDEWELVTNDEGITKIKVNENEYYDFGSMPYCSSSLQADEEMMLTAEEYLDLQNKGLDLLLANGNISLVEDKDEINKISQYLEDDE